MKNIALEIIKAAVEQNMTVEVFYDEQRGYHGQSWALAWEACKAAEMCSVQIRNTKGKLIGTMCVIPGLDPDETVADFSSLPNGAGWLDDQWNKVFRENQASS